MYTIPTFDMTSVMNTVENNTLPIFIALTLSILSISVYKTSRSLALAQAGEVKAKAAAEAAEKAAAEAAAEAAEKAAEAEAENKIQQMEKKIESLEASHSVLLTEFKGLMLHLNTLHKTRIVRNDTQRKYNDNTRNRELITANHTAQVAYKMAKDSLSSYVITSCS